MTGPLATDAATPAVPTRMRRAVIRSVTASAAVPQYSVELDIDAGVPRDARAALRDRVPDASVSDLLHLAVARTLPRHPLLNSAWTDRGVVTSEAVNLAFIVEVADGMLTPSIAGADRLDLAGLAAARIRLTAGARAGTLRGEELLSGTFTVSNLGPLGIHRFRAMVLPPQAAVLAVGAPDPAGRLTLALTCDHRVVDGAPAARFLADLGARLADPAWLTDAAFRPADPHHTTGAAT